MAVLSFLGKILMRTNNILFIMQKNKITMSLQVPCSPLFNISKSYLPGKRVLPFTLQKNKEKGIGFQMGKQLHASMTVEAAIVLPLFVFFGLAVLAPMQWMDSQRKHQISAERFGEELSQYAYMMENGLQESEILNENGDIQFELEYKEKVPFFGAIGNVTMNVAVKRRCWVGIEGKLTGQNADGSIVGQEKDMVYVTPEGQKYHRYRDCRHLTNVCKAVSAEAVSTMRNSDGKIFYGCEYCVKGKETQDTVYITTWGIRYHNDRSCAAMSNYFRKVPLEEVEYMGECSVCAGRRDGDSEN